MEGEIVSDVDIKVDLMMLGDAAVGKTWLMMRYTSNSFDASQIYILTVGIDHKTKIIDLDGTKVKLSLWDTGGQERFRSIAISYYRSAHGIMLVYDVTDRDTFTSVTHWITRIQEHADACVSIVLVGNKCDLEDQRLVSYQEGQDLANQFQLQFFETSAKNDIRVTEAYTYLATIAKNRLQSRRAQVSHADTSHEVITLEASATGNTKKKSKCTC